MSSLCPRVPVSPCPGVCGWRGAVSQWPGCARCPRQGTWHGVGWQHGVGRELAWCGTWCGAAWDVAHGTRRDAAHGRARCSTWHSVAHGAVWHMASYGTAWRRPGMCHATTWHNTAWRRVAQPLRGKRPGTDWAITAATPEHRVPAIWPGPPRGPGHPAATALAESKILRPGHVAPRSHSFLAVCRCPPRCPALPPAPSPESVTGSTTAGTATAAGHGHPTGWHPLPFGDTRGGDDVTMKKPGPACFAVGDRDPATAVGWLSPATPPARLRRGGSVHGLRRGGHRYVTPTLGPAWRGGEGPQTGGAPGLSVTGGMLAAPVSLQGWGPSLQGHPGGRHCPPHAPAPREKPPRGRDVPWPGSPRGSSCLAGMESSRVAPVG